MGFPTVASSAASGAFAATTTFNATMPSGIVSGDLLLAAGFRTDSTTDWTDPSGWTRIATASGSGRRSWLWAKVAAGSDTLAIDRSGSSGDIAAIIFRVTEFAGNGTADVEASLTVDFSGDWDAPSLTATWGATDNLFLTLLGRAGLNVTVWPSGYDSNRVTSFSDGLYGGLGLCSKTSTLATDDPAAAAPGNGGIMHMGTIVVRGTAPAGPTITDQPDNETVVEGDPATFTVAATGTGTLTYQWQEDDGGGFSNVTNGGAYSGATTATLTIDPTTLGLDGYLYRCNVTDDNGTTASSSAELTVTPAPLSVTVALTDEGDDPVGAITVPKIYAIRYSDDTLVHTFTSVTLDSGGEAVLSHASLTAVPHVFVPANTTGSLAGGKILTPD